MKKIMSLLLAVMCIVTMLATVSCGDEKDPLDTKNDTSAKTDAPKTDAPETEAPKTEAPETDAPETDAPEEDIPDGIVYKYTSAIVPGKEYIIALEDGDKIYALTDNGGTIASTELTADMFADEDTLLYAKGTDVTALSWDCLYNKGDNPAKGLFFQNVSTKYYLTCIDGELLTEEDPLGVELNGNSQSDAFKYHVWAGEPLQEDIPLATYLDNEATLNIKDGEFCIGYNAATVLLYEKYEPEYDTWVLVDHLESNEEYLIVNSNTEGDAIAMESVIRDIYPDIDVEIKKSAGGNLYIEFESAFNEFTTWAAYETYNDYFFICTWNTPTSGEVLRLGESAPSVTSSYGDSTYYFRFKYDYNTAELTAALGLDGNDTVRGLYFNGDNMSTLGGSGIYFYKRVASVD